MTPETLADLKFVLTCLDDGLHDLARRRLEQVIAKAEHKQIEDERQLELNDGATLGYGG